MLRQSPSETGCCLAPAAQWKAEPAAWCHSLPGPWQACSRSLLVRMARLRIGDTELPPSWHASHGRQMSWEAMHVDPEMPGLQSAGRAGRLVVEKGLVRRHTRAF